MRLCARCAPEILQLKFAGVGILVQFLRIEAKAGLGSHLYVFVSVVVEKHEHV